MKKFNYGWVMAFLAFAVLFIGSYAQYQLSPLSYLLIPQMNLTTSQFSGIFSAAMIPGICLSLAAGLLCDKLGVKKCITAAVLIATLGVVLRIFSNSYGSLLGCMILAGLGCTFINPNAAKYLGAWFAPEKLGTMIGITMAGSNLAMAVAMGTTAMFPDVRSAYIFAAVLAVMVLAAWVLLARKSEAEKAAEGSKRGPEVTVLAGLKEVGKNRDIWVIGLFLMLLMGSVMTLSAFLPMALQSARGVSAAESGIVASVMMFGNLAGTVLGPVICARLGNMKRYLFICVLIAAAGMAFAWKLPTGLIMSCGMFVTGFAASGMIPIAMSLPIGLASIGPRLAGTAGGFVSTIQLCGCVIIPTYIIAPIAGSNYSIIMLLAGVSCLLGIVCVVLFPVLATKK